MVQRALSLNEPFAYQDSKLSKRKKKKESTKQMETAESKLHKREHFRSETCYTIWNDREHRFSDPVPYDFTFPIQFPNLMLRARDLKEAKAKIETINRKAEGIDRFEFNKRGVL